MSGAIESAMGGGAPPRAVLLDALGTLLELEPPAPALGRELRTRFGIAAQPAELERAVAAEIDHYRAHHDEGRDAASLAALRERCAAVLRDALPSAAGVPLPELTAMLLAALRFAPFPDAAPALRALRAGGARLVAVSNWDVSLHDVLARTGLAPLLDGAVSSAEVGARKPDPAIFRRALELAGVAAGDALHVGDSAEADLAGARAAGIAALLIVRHGPPPPGVPAIRTLAELTVDAVAAR